MHALLHYNSIIVTPINLSAFDYYCLNASINDLNDCSTTLSYATEV